jgi:hypothetical protein
MKAIRTSDSVATNLREGGFLGDLIWLAAKSWWALLAALAVAALAGWQVAVAIVIGLIMVAGSLLVWDSASLMRPMGVLEARAYRRQVAKQRAELEAHGLTPAQYLATIQGTWERARAMYRFDVDATGQPNERTVTDPIPERVIVEGGKGDSTPKGRAS